MLRYLLPCLLVTAACASDAPSVSGTWRAQPNAFDAGANLGPWSWTFQDDGVVVLADPDDPVEARYELDGDRMRLSIPAGDETLELDFAFVVDSEGMLLGALLPAGPVDGAIGTWSATAVVNGEASDHSLTLDGAGRADYETDDTVETGTWEEDGTSLVLRFDSHDEYRFRIGEEAIGDVLLQPE